LFECETPSVLHISDITLQQAVAVNASTLAGFINGNSDLIRKYDGRKLWPQVLKQWHSSTQSSETFGILFTTESPLDVLEWHPRNSRLKAALARRSGETNRILIRFRTMSSTVAMISDVDILPDNEAAGICGGSWRSWS
jgi:hypothetical protein